MIDDYLSLEPLLIERLRESVTDIRHVLNAADLAGVKQAAQSTPAIHVLYYGDRLGDSAGTKRARHVYQQWLTIMVIKDVRSQRTGQAAREQAGPFITGIIQALQGWKPGAGFGELARFIGPRPFYQPGGFLYVPLGWESLIATEGTST